MTSLDISAATALHLKKDQPSGLTGKNDDGEARGQAWQREMERAQMESWLSHGVVGHAPSAGATLLPSAVAATPAVTESAGAPPGDETATSGLEDTAPASVSPEAASAGTAQAAEHGAGRNIPARARSVARQTDPTAALADPPAQQQRPSLPPTASPRAKEVVASHAPHWPPRGLAVAASVHAPQQSAPPVEGGAAIPESPQQVTVGASRAAPMSFDAAGLTQALQAFGTIGASTEPASIAAEVPPGPELEKLRGLSRAEQAIALAAGRTAEPPRGLSVATAVHADLSLQPHAPDQRTLGPADRPAKPPHGPGASAAAEPIRVHADWSEDGVRVWLGMDSAALDSLEQITTQLHAWLNAQGLRLRSLSCNGQSLSEDPVLPEVLDDAESGEAAGVTPEPIAKELP
jgi:hypothetical protein